MRGNGRVAAEGTRASVLVAGVPRSGSTWVFNAARLLLLSAGRDVHAAWVADHDPGHAAAVHLVKAHHPAEVRFAPDIVLTTSRPVEECLASLVRMGWIDAAPETLRRARDAQLALHAHWHARTACEVAFADILARPEAAVAQVATALGPLARGADDPAMIAASVGALAPPSSGGYDRVTLLHPRHRAEGATGLDANAIRDLMAPEAPG